MNCAVWPTLSEDDDNEELLGVELKSVAAVYNHFHEMDVLKKIETETVTDGYVEIVRYCQKFFNIENVDPIELWHKVLLVSKDKENWLSISLIIEICLCTPSSNATLERFFNHLKVVKTNQRARLSADSLNSILPIKMKKLWHNVFHDEYSVVQ